MSGESQPRLYRSAPDDSLFLNPSPHKKIISTKKINRYREIPQ